MSEAPQADPSTGGFNTFSFCGCLELPEPARNADKNAALKIRWTNLVDLSSDGAIRLPIWWYPDANVNRDKPKLQDSTPVQKLLFLRLSAGVLVTLLGNANKIFPKMSEIFQDILSLAGEEGPRYRYCSKERWWVAISKPTQSNNEFRFQYVYCRTQIEQALCKFKVSEVVSSNSHVNSVENLCMSAEERSTQVKQPKLIQPEQRVADATGYCGYFKHSPFWYKFTDWISLMSIRALHSSSPFRCESSF